MLSHQDIAEFKQRNIGCRPITTAAAAQAEQLALLMDPSRDPERFLECLDRIDEDGLRPFNYDFSYINYLSAFGDTHPLEKIRQLAKESIKLKLWSCLEFRTYLTTSFLEGGHLLRLDGWGGIPLCSLVSQYGRLIVCVSHFGAYRYVLTDLLQLGFDICMALNSDAAYGLHHQFRNCPPSEQLAEVNRYRFSNGSTLQLIDVETDRFASAKLSKALTRKAIVLVFADGNSGSDGDWGTANKSTCELLGKVIRIKTGFAELAATTNSPILNLFTKRLKAENAFSLTDFQAQVHLGGVTLPTVFKERASAVSEWAKTYYTEYADWIRSSPVQWEGVILFHRLRYLGVPRESSVTLTDVDAQVETHNQGQQLWILRTTRMAIMRTRSSPMVLNVETLRARPITMHQASALEPFLAHRNGDHAPGFPIAGSYLDRWDPILRKTLQGMHLLIPSCDL